MKNQRTSPIKNHDYVTLLRNQKRKPTDDVLKEPIKLPSRLPETINKPPALSSQHDRSEDVIDLEEDNRDNSIQDKIIRVPAVGSQQTENQIITELANAEFQVSVLQVSITESVS